MQKIRLKDVAERAGVAVNTASTILNRRPNSWASKETEERVFQAAAELGYKPNRAAQALRFGRFDAIAFLVADLNDPFCAAFADAMEEAAETRGCELIIETSRNDPARARRIFDELAHRNVDGIAALAPAEAAPGGLPFITICAAGAPLPPGDAVLADFEPGLRDAAGALAALGHERFALLCAPGARHIGDAMRRALAGKRNASCEVIPCGCGPAAAREFSSAMLRDDAPPTAIVAQTDLHAIGVMRAAADAGLRIPRDLSVVSMENSPLAACLPVSLSAISQPVAVMAARAVEMLISRIESGAAGRHAGRAVFATEFIARESVGAARR